MTHTSPIYLDNHATTRLDPRVLETMMPYLTQEYGNAGSRTHSYGVRARDAVENARVLVAELVGATPGDIIFTSGATEANNLAIMGLLAQEALGHIVTVQTEHHAVLEVCQSLEAKGWRVTYLPVDIDGRLDLDLLVRSICEDTRLVTVMWANNETGVLQDVAKIGAICQERGVPFHSDAVQAAGRVEVSLNNAQVDLISLSGHKIYGPKGVGALVARRHIRRRLTPILSGGGQEWGLRPGTTPVAQVVGLGHAAKLAAIEVRDGNETSRILKLRDTLLKSLSKEAGDIEINGSLTHRLPGNLNVWFRGVDTEALAIQCRDVAFSTGSACTSSSLNPSHVILAMAGDEDRASQSARFGLGRFTLESDIYKAASSLSKAVRALRPLNRKLPYEPQFDYGTKT